MITIQCSCGKEVKLEEQDPTISQDTGTKYMAFCSCNKKWELQECSEEYEELLMNGVINPENGEYEKDDVWYYSDGECME